MSQPAPTSPAEKATAALKSRVDLVVERLTAAQAQSHQAQVREALTRTELTLALNAALIARAEAEARAREQAFRAFAAIHAPRRRLRRPGPFSTWWERVPGLRARGYANIIRHTGLWRGADGGDLAEIEDYVRRGADPGARPAALLHQAWYLETYPDVAASGRAPLLHYVMMGGSEGRSPHPLFDVAYYSRENADELGAAGVTPLEHFEHRGMALGRNPHPLFDLRHYVAQAPDIGPADDPLNHYLREGWVLGLSPHPLFDPKWYVRQVPSAHRGPPLLHYLDKGWKRASPHPLFDPSWYVEQYADVGESGLEPLTHFLVSGAADGRSPSPWFDLPHYVAQRGRDLARGANPLIDYLQGGAWAVTEARPGFPTAAYLAASPELVRDGLTPLEHWARRQAP